MVSYRLYIPLAFIALALTGILACTTGIYFDGGSDTFAYHVIRGNFTSTPVAYFSSFGFYAFISGIIAWLYRCSPHIPWFDLTVFTNISIGVFLLLLLWRIVAFPFPLFILFAIPWLDNVLLPELTKQGFWISFLSLMIYHKCHKGQIGARICMVILFAYAFMIRAEPAFFAIICFYLFHLAAHIYTNRSELFSFHIELLPFISVAIIFSVLLNINFTKQDEMYKSFRPYQFTLWDFKQDPSTIHLADKSDSVILMAAQKNFISDLAKINQPFFEKIGLRKKDKTLSSISGYFETNDFLKKKITEELTVAKEYLYASFAFVVLVIIYLFGSSPSGKQSKISLVSVFSVCLLLFTFLCIFMKLERHLILPFVMGGVLYLISYSAEKTVNRPWLMVPVILGSVILAHNVWGQFKSMRSIAGISSEISTDINQRFPDSIVYIDLYMMVKLHNKLFEKDNFPYDRALSFDNAIISYYPEWAEKMKRLKQPATTASLAEEFTSGCPKIIFIFSKGRQHLFEEYFSIVYGKKVTFEEIASPLTVGQKYRYSYFRVSNQGD